MLVGSVETGACYCQRPNLRKSLCHFQTDGFGIGLINGGMRCQIYIGFQFFSFRPHNIYPGNRNSTVHTFFPQSIDQIKLQIIDIIVVIFLVGSQYAA